MRLVACVVGAPLGMAAVLGGGAVSIVGSAVPLLTRANPTLATRFCSHVFARGPRLGSVFGVDGRHGNSRQRTLFGTVYTCTNGVRGLTILLPTIRGVTRGRADFVVATRRCGVINNRLVTALSRVFSPNRRILST